MPFMTTGKFPKALKAANPVAKVKKPKLKMPKGKMAGKMKMPKGCK